MNFDIPPFFIGTDIDIPSGISCKHIAIAKLKPNFNEASKPEPIANPSGKLCIANPIETIIPVFSNSLLFLYFFFTIKFFCTITSQKSLKLFLIIHLKSLRKYY